MGEIAALSCAVLWAASTVAMRSQTGRVPVFALNAIRAGYASLVYLVGLALLGRLSSVPEVPFEALASLIGSVLIGMAVGDTLHLQAMKLIGVSRAMPIASVHPLFTVALAVTWLGEPLSLGIVLGTLLVVAGVYLVAFPGARALAADGPIPPLGIALSLGAAVCWALSTATVKPAMALVDPLVANAIRMPVAMLVLILLATRSEGLPRPFAYGRRTGAVLGLAGVISGVSGAFWLFAVQLAGAGKTAALSSTAPVFSAPLAALFLGERLSPRVAGGTALTVAGVWLVL